ncbi:alpha/beta hydrolase [Lampropedia puyangensis]|uniref:Alpha/beta hydrolase n=1 Tax=Lampropedia puyangensis TaxID=1330072 RepID=A0A4S8F186_9BURK|nr:alpha/beta hydrolase [Lampropedia puyangensis]THU01033.1 alpha/beta hydrolase [Lampropedia puyangensis]
MPYASINGQRLYFEDTGGDQPAIIFSHGLLMDGDMFAPQINALHEQWRCITWDERGHGRTANGQSEPFTYYDSANDAVALLDHLGIEQAVFAGMSQGGYLSLRAALRHPSRVRALVLIDTQALPEEAHKMVGHKKLIEQWATSGLSDPAAQTIAHLILGDGWPSSGEWMDRWKRMQVGDLLQCFQTLAARDDISDAIHAIQVPALVIHGTQDLAIDITRARTMAQSLRNAVWAPIEGGGHAPNLTHPEPVNQAISDFLKTL